MEKLINFIIVSSANPAKVSASVKGFLMMVAGLLAHVFTGVDFTPFVDAIVDVVHSVLLLGGAIITAYGLGRKLWRTIQGTNEALKLED